MPTIPQSSQWELSDFQRAGLACVYFIRWYFPVSKIAENSSFLPTSAVPCCLTKQPTAWNIPKICLLLLRTTDYLPANSKWYFLFIHHFLRWVRQTNTMAGVVQKAIHDFSLSTFVKCVLPWRCEILGPENAHIDVDSKYLSVRTLWKSHGFGAYSFYIVELFCLW